MKKTLKTLAFAALVLMTVGFVASCKNATDDASGSNFAAIETAIDDLNKVVMAKAEHKDTKKYWNKQLESFNKNKADYKKAYNSGGKSKEEVVKGIKKLLNNFKTNVETLETGDAKTALVKAFDDTIAKIK